MNMLQSLINISTLNLDNDKLTVLCISLIKKNSFFLLSISKGQNGRAVATYPNQCFLLNHVHNLVHFFYHMYGHPYSALPHPSKIEKNHVCSFVNIPDLFNSLRHF